jgi:hypothetical protein
MRRRAWSAAACLVTVVALGACTSAGSGLASTDTTAPSDTGPLLDCAGSFPVSALHNPPGAEQAAEPAAKALRDYLAANPSMFEGPHTGWRKLVDTKDLVMFARLSDSPDSFGSVVNVDRKGDEWKVGLSAACGTAWAARADAERAGWTLDPAALPPTPASTRIPVLVTGSACNDGKPIDPRRLETPDIQLTADRVLVTWWLTPTTPDGSMHTCPGNAGVPAVLELPEPLGARKLFDGGAYPAQPVR